MDYLEETKSTTEVVESNSNEEDTPTEPKKEPTVRTYSQAELDEKVGKGSATVNRLLTASKAEADAAKAQSEAYKTLQEETERRLNELEEKQFAGDEDALKGFRNVKSIELREKKTTLREKELDSFSVELENSRLAITLSNKATELLGQYEVPKKILELCSTSEQMEDIAKDYPEIGKNPEKKKPKFAGAGEERKSVNTNDMTPSQKIEEGLKRASKN